MKMFYQVMITLSVLESMGGGWAEGAIIEETIIDERTGLEWRITPKGGEFSDTVARSQADAVAYCNSLGESWRLPNVAEFQSIIDFEEEGTTTIRDGLYRDYELGAFRSWFFVTSTNYPDNSDHVYIINLLAGDVSVFHDQKGFAIRCVNGG